MGQVHTQFALYCIAVYRNCMDSRSVHFVAHREHFQFPWCLHMHSGLDGNDRSALITLSRRVTRS